MTNVQASMTNEAKAPVIEIWSLGFGIGHWVINL